MDKKLCIICLDTCKTQLNLQLNCDCKYIVHYKCFNTWWKRNHNCIICKEICKKQIKGQKYIKFKEKDSIIKNIIERRYHSERYEPRRRPNFHRDIHLYENIRGSIFTEYYLERQRNMEICSKILQFFFYLLLVLIIWLLYKTV